jgi:hypothetical protein
MSIWPSEAELNSVSTVSSVTAISHAQLTAGHTPAHFTTALLKSQNQTSRLDSIVPPNHAELCNSANSSQAVQLPAGQNHQEHQATSASVTQSNLLARVPVDGSEGTFSGVRVQHPKAPRQSQLRTLIESTKPAPVKKVHFDHTDEPNIVKVKCKPFGETFVAKQPRNKATSSLTVPTLPPTYFSAHMLPLSADPLRPEGGVSVVAQVDSGCKPFTIISDSLVEQAGLLLENRPTRLRLADKVTVVESQHMTTFVLRVTILEHPRLFTIRAVVWKSDQLVEPLVIGQADALRTGLSVFVHDNKLREAILGQHALHHESDSGPIREVPATVASIISPGEDQDLLERISPLEAFRAAMQPAETTKDEWVNEFLRSDLAPLFGPLSSEPARVPFLDFDVNESAIKSRTYSNTIPIRLPPASARKQDSLYAHVSELLEYNAVQMAYPGVTPGPIASVAFTVNKAGVIPLPRPADMDRNFLPDAFRNRTPVSSITDSLSEAHKAYVESLTSDRLVVSFKPVNDVSVVQHYPTPTVQENLQKLSRFKFFASVDLRKAFWSVGVSDRCKKYLYTIAPGGLAFFWLRAPMGHSAVPGHFQYCIDGVLGDLRHFAFAFADDIIIGANSEAELKRNIRLVLEKLLDANFRVNAKKCQFQPRTSIQYLGWIVGNNQVLPTEPFLDKLWRIRKPSQSRGDAAEKRNLIKRFLGTVQYLGHYIPLAADELHALHVLTKVKDKHSPDGKASFTWTTQADEAWEWAVSRMREIKPLHFPSYLPGSRLETFSDASKYGWGGLLVEFREGDPKPYIIMCVSGTFTPSQLGWSTIMKECFAVWSTIRKLKIHLDSAQFIVNMDHRDLLWSSMSTNEVVRRMATDLQQFRFTMRHIEGPSNILADHLSRAEYLSPEEFSALQIRMASRSLSPALVEPSPAEQAAADGDTGDIGEEDDYTVCSESSFVSTIQLDSGSDFTDQFLSESEGSVGGCAEIPNPSSDSEPEDHKVAQSASIPPAESPAPLQPLQLSPSRRQSRRRAGGHQLQPPAMQPQPPDDQHPIPHLQPHPEPEARILSPERYHLIAKYHGGVNPHQGVQPLLQALRADNHNWQGIEADCRSFVVRCHHCQLERLNRRGASALPYRSVLLPSRLFEVWNFDIIGPLQVCGLTGARYLLVGIEETSKFLMLGYSISIATMELILFFLDCFKIFGLPLIIKSDLGVQFISKAVREFCQATGITQKFGVAHRHESDGTVEIGIKQVWQYLRLAVHDLRKYDAWTPLICNVQLGCNALTRDVLGGASASTLVFNRKVKPLRFMRPESIPPASDAEVLSPSISTFIADNAAAQLDLLHRADSTRTSRYLAQQELAQEARAEAEEQEELVTLDWVRINVLVSIPQPEAGARLRPEKMSLRRRGPYEVTECDPETTTVMLRDYKFPQRPSFRWPKELLWPYHAASLPALPVPVAMEGEPSELPIVCDPECANAIMECRHLHPQVVPNAPRHVRNHEYLVRWTGRPHLDTTWAPYSSVWSTHAFQEFLVDSHLVGHVPPTAYALAHRRHAQQLLTGTSAPNRRVHLTDMSQIPRLLHYFPLEMPRKPNKRALLSSQRQSVRFQEDAVNSEEQHQDLQQDP